jgi:hypothetical protein
MLETRSQGLSNEEIAEILGEAVTHARGARKERGREACRSRDITLTFAGNLV